MESEENLSLEKQNSEINISVENSSPVKLPPKTPIQEQSQETSINIPANNEKFSNTLLNSQNLLNTIVSSSEQRLENKSIDCEEVDISEIKNINEKVVALYPTVGENLDYLNSNNLKLNFLYRKLDQYSWQYCNKGFFNFKNYIPKIISFFN